MAGAAALGGVGAGINGGVKMKKASDTMKAAEKMNNDSVKEFETLNKSTTDKMDKLGKFELEILNSFEKFSELFEKIQNKPEFAEVNIEGAKIPKYDGKKIKDVAVGAAVLIGGLGGAAAGAAGGFAAAGATTAAVMALGTASTGTAIASLSGVAATNATLAALGGGAIAAGGGAIAAGGGGIALGTTILGASTLGVGLLVGGIIFSVVGNGTTKKADEAYSAAKENKAKIDKICAYLRKLSTAADSFHNTLDHLNKVYTRHLQIIDVLVNVSGKTDYNLYTDTEKLALENTVYLVGMLYKCCQTKLVLQSNNENDTNSVNFNEVNDIGREATGLLKKKDFAESQATAEAYTVALNDIKNTDGIYVCLSCGAQLDEIESSCPFCDTYGSIVRKH